MNVIDHITPRLNYYLRTSIDLSIIAYDIPMSHIKKDVYDKTKLELCWGPAERINMFVPYSRMFVAKNPSTDEYFVVIQGTNPASLEAWFKEDFAVKSGQPFSSLPGNPPNAPASAIISEGTFNGMSDLINLRDPNSNMSVVEFLKSVQPGFTYITGHSLGGTLCPTMLAYLNAMLYNGKEVTNIALWSFAGLTPGGKGFNDYFNSIFPYKYFDWRIQNSLDLAPHFWGSEEEAKTIYVPYRLTWAWDSPSKLYLEHVYNDAAKSGIGYQQAQNGLVLKGTFDPSKNGLEGAWMAQGIHQHSSKTYRDLVYKQFPLDE